jgi:ferrous iron transport protein A
MTVSNVVNLTEVAVGEKIKITQILLEGVLRRRVFDLGFIPGTNVVVLQKSPLGDPTAFCVRNTTIALRKEEAQKILGELTHDE